MYKKAILGALLTLAPPAYATAIFHSIADLGASRYRAELNVINDTLGVDIEEFTVFYDVFQYDNLSIGASPAGWDPLVIQPDTVLPDDGFVDFLALATGISVGSQLSGFAVEFDYLGAGSPNTGWQYEVIDPITFATIDLGTTLEQVIGDPPSDGTIPIPSTLILIITGLGVLYCRPKQYKLCLC